MMAWLRYLVSLPFVATIRAACWVTGWSSYEVGQLALLVAAGCILADCWPSWLWTLLCLPSICVLVVAALDLGRLQNAPPSDVLPDPGLLDRLLTLRPVYLFVLVLSIPSRSYSIQAFVCLIVLATYAYEMGRHGGPSCVRRALDAIGRLHLGSLRLRPALVGR